MQLGSGEDAIISFELLADGHRVERLTLNLNPNPNQMKRGLHRVEWRLILTPPEPQP